MSHAVDHVSSSRETQPMTKSQKASLGMDGQEGSRDGQNCLVFIIIINNAVAGA